MGKRKYKRYTKRIEVEFKAGSRVYKGFSSDVSENGLFVKTRNSMIPGSPVDMKLYLPDGKVSKVKGLVRRAVKTHSTIVKNGMGIEVLEYDQFYAEFLKELVGELRGPDLSNGSPGEDDADNPVEPEVVVIACPSCGVKNRIPTSKRSRGPKCGKCKEALPTG